MIFKRVFGFSLFSLKAVCSICLAILSISLSLGVNSTIIKPNKNEVWKTITSVFFPERDYKKQDKIIKKIKKLDSKIIRSDSSISEIERRDIYMSLYRQLQKGSKKKEYDFYSFQEENNLDYYITKGNFSCQPYMFVKSQDRDGFRFIHGWNMNVVGDIISKCKENKTPLMAIKEIFTKKRLSGGICHDVITENFWDRADTQPNVALSKAILKRSIFK